MKFNIGEKVFLKNENETVTVVGYYVTNHGEAYLVERVNGCNNFVEEDDIEPLVDKDEPVIKKNDDYDEFFPWNALYDKEIHPAPPRYNVGDTVVYNGTLYKVEKVKYFDMFGDAYYSYLLTSDSAPNVYVRESNIEPHVEFGNTVMVALDDDFLCDKRNGFGVRVYKDVLYDFYHNADGWYMLVDDLGLYIKVDDETIKRLFREEGV